LFGLYILVSSAISTCDIRSDSPVPLVNFCGFCKYQS